jgi:hypothetical protein
LTLSRVWVVDGGAGNHVSGCLTDPTATFFNGVFIGAQCTPSQRCS